MLSDLRVLEFTTAFAGPASRPAVVQLTGIMKLCCNRSAKKFSPYAVSSLGTSQCGAIPGNIYRLEGSPDEVISPFNTGIYYRWIKMSNIFKRQAKCFKHIWCVVFN